MASAARPCFRRTHPKPIRACPSSPGCSSSWAIRSDSSMKAAARAGSFRLSMACPHHRAASQALALKVMSAASARSRTPL